MADPITCMIVDDDLMTLKIIRSLVEKTAFLKLVGVYENPVDARNAFAESPVALMFIDIEMPEMNGLELVNALSPRPQVILISQKGGYALNAFDYEVTDYLLKPVESYARFLKAVQRAQANIYKNKEEKNSRSATDKEHVYLKVDSLLVKFSLKDILWIEAFGDYVKVHTSEKVYTVYATMKAIQELLPDQAFLRIHRSYIVRTDRIENIDIGNLQVRNKILPIGNSYKKNLMDNIQTL